jgi:hypothetical protein
MPGGSGSGPFASCAGEMVSDPALSDWTTAGEDADVDRALVHLIEARSTETRYGPSPTHPGPERPLLAAHRALNLDLEV